MKLLYNCYVIRHFQDNYRSRIDSSASEDEIEVAFQETFEYGRWPNGWELPHQKQKKGHRYSVYELVQSRFIFVYRETEEGADTYVPVTVLDINEVNVRNVYRDMM